MRRDFWCSATKSRGRPRTARLVELDRRLIEIVHEHKPISVRGTFYRAEAVGLLPKLETAVRLVGRELLKLRRAGAVPYESISDESRDVVAYQGYDGVGELSQDVARLYRRDYWRHAEEYVQVWVEKRALTGVLSPVVARKWGLTLYSCVGQPSETYLWRGGEEIRAQGVPTTAYVLTDFDPAGSVIFNTLKHGSKDAPGGLSRFTGGVPVEVVRLALDADQVRAWNLPSRPAKRSDSRAAKFIERHGDVSTELDAIPPNDLRRLVDEAIGRHMDPRQLDMLKLIESDERSQLAAFMLRFNNNMESENGEPPGTTGGA